MVINANRIRLRDKQKSMKACRGLLLVPKPNLEGHSPGRTNVDHFPTSVKLKILFN